MALTRRLRKIVEITKTLFIYKFIYLKVSALFRTGTKGKILLSVIAISLFLYIGLDEDYDSSDLYRNQVSSFDYFYSVNNTRNIHLRPDRETIKLGFVVCSTRLEEAVTMLKTAIFFSYKANVNLHLIGISDLRNDVPLTKHLQDLSEAAMGLDIYVNYEIHRIWLPSMSSKKYWVEMFAPCSSQRLFFPVSLPHIDHLMYIDTDALFLSNITDLWNEFKKMEPSHIAAVANEHELPGDGWYNKYSEIPYTGPRGLNAGIMLMNLTAMRKINFGDRIQTIFEEYGSKIHWADQDLINILFHFYPEFLYRLDCRFNYRHQHCKCDFPGTGDCNCKSAERTGISILHGNRQRFHNSFFRSAPLFLTNIYDRFKQYDLRSDSPSLLYSFFIYEYFQLMDKNVNEPCSNISDVLFAKFEQFSLTVSHKEKSKKIYPPDKL